MTKNLYPCVVPIILCCLRGNYMSWTPRNVFLSSVQSHKSINASEQKQNNHCQHYKRSHPISSLRYEHGRFTKFCTFTFTHLHSERNMPDYKMKRKPDRQFSLSTAKRYNQEISPCLLSQASYSIIIARIFVTFCPECDKCADHMTSCFHKMDILGIHSWHPTG